MQCIDYGHHTNRYLLLLLSSDRPKGLKFPSAMVPPFWNSKQQDFVNHYECLYAFMKHTETDEYKNNITSGSTYHQHLLDAAKHRFALDFPNEENPFPPLQVLDKRRKSLPSGSRSSSIRKPSSQIIDKTRKDTYKFPSSSPDTIEEHDSKLRARLRAIPPAVEAPKHDSRSRASRQITFTKDSKLKQGLSQNN